MHEQRSPKRRRCRFLRRSLKAIALIALGVALIAVVGVTVVWGHFWEFRIGDPTSESCGRCHLLQSYVESLTDPVMLASRHTLGNVECIDCHERTLEYQVRETIAYLTNDYPQPFVRAQYPMTTCFQCHTHTSYDQLAWRTTDLGISDAQAHGRPANPHQPPHYSNLECHSCHRMHRPSTLLCAECHAYQFRIPVQPQ